LLRRVPWVGSPTSSLLLRHSDSSTPRLTLRSSLALCRSTHFLKVSRSPRFLGNLRTRRVLRPRWGQVALVIGLAALLSVRPDVAFRRSHGVGPHDSSISGLNLLGSHFPLSTLRSQGRPLSPRKTRFRLVTFPWPGRVRTCKVPSSGFNHGSTWHPPPPGLSWRTASGYSRSFDGRCNAVAATETTY
jgi:hypothetical protein